MTTQPEALRLADELEDSLYSADGTSLSPYGQGIADKAAAEVRRLHESNQELLAALRDLMADNSDLSMTQHLALYRKARAAIAKAERTTT